ncbi:MAG: TraR/DksA C4-type zinc finger protein [Pseudomonadota bacterium]
MADFEKYREKLEKRRKYLVMRLENIEDELDQPSNPNWDDDATESEQDEVLEDLGVSGQEEIKAIDAALQRMDDGTYGYCVVSGEKISEERLDVLPHTPFCKKHAPSA